MSVLVGASLTCCPACPTRQAPALAPVFNSKPCTPAFIIVQKSRLTQSSHRRPCRPSRLLSAGASGSGILTSRDGTGVLCTAMMLPIMFTGYVKDST